MAGEAGIEGEVGGGGQGAAAVVESLGAASACAVGAAPAYFYIRSYTGEQPPAWRASGHSLPYVVAYVRRWPEVPSTHLRRRIWPFRCNVDHTDVRRCHVPANRIVQVSVHVGFLWHWDTYFPLTDEKNAPLYHTDCAAVHWNMIPLLL